MEQASLGSYSWREHRILADVVRDSSMAFRETDDNGREIHCPVCFQYRDGTSDVAFSVNQRLSELKKKHRQALGKQPAQASIGGARTNLADGCSSQPSQFDYRENCFTYPERGVQLFSV